MKRLIAVFLACFALLVGTSIPAQAYSSGSCHPLWGTSNARLSVTKWNSSHYEGNLYVYSYTYHIDMNPYGNYHSSTVFMDDANLNRTNDFYISSWNYRYTHKFTGRWYVWPAGSHGELGYKYCTFWL